MNKIMALLHIHTERVEVKKFLNLSTLHISLFAANSHLNDFNRHTGLLFIRQIASNCDCLDLSHSTSINTFGSELVVTVGSET